MKEYQVQVFGNRTQWFYNGELHRGDGPAVEWYNGDKEWWLNDERHRLDGPAVEGPSGYKEWWIDGVEYTEAEFLAKTRPAKELTIPQLEEILGYTIKIIKGN
jgi:hypothetical protein